MLSAALGDITKAESEPGADIPIVSPEPAETTASENDAADKSAADSESAGDSPVQELLAKRKAGSAETPKIAPAKSGATAASGNEGNSRIQEALKRLSEMRKTET